MPSRFSLPSLAPQDIEHTVQPQKPISDGSKIALSENLGDVESFAYERFDAADLREAAQQSPATSPVNLFDLRQGASEVEERERLQR
jgi:hypothetical protein